MLALGSFSWVRTGWPSPTGRPVSRGVVAPWIRRLRDGSVRTSAPFPSAPFPACPEHLRLAKSAARPRPGGHLQAQLWPFGRLVAEIQRRVALSCRCSCPRLGVPPPFDGWIIARCVTVVRSAWAADLKLIVAHTAVGWRNLDVANCNDAHNHQTVTSARPFRQFRGYSNPPRLHRTTFTSAMALIAPVEGKQGPAGSVRPEAAASSAIRSTVGSTVLHRMRKRRASSFGSS